MSTYLIELLKFPASDFFFGLFAVSLLIYAFLLMRFIHRVKQLGDLQPEDSKGLGLLLLTGGGRFREEWNALRFFLSRSYASINNPSIVRCGDQARISFFVSLALLVAWSITASIGAV